MDVILILFCLVSLAISLYLYDKYLFKPLPYSLEIESYYDLAARRYGMAAEEE
jgi:hypothetical protein